MLARLACGREEPQSDADTVAVTDTVGSDDSEGGDGAAHVEELGPGAPDASPRRLDRGKVDHQPLLHPRSGPLRLAAVAELEGRRGAVAADQVERQGAEKAHVVELWAMGGRRDVATTIVPALADAVGQGVRPASFALQSGDLGPQTAAQTRPRAGTTLQQ